MDKEEDGRAVEVVYRLQPNLLSQLVPIEDLVLTSDSVGEEEHMPSTEPLVIQDYQAGVDRQREEDLEGGHMEMNAEADHLVEIGEAPEPYVRAMDPETLETIPNPPDYVHPPGFWDGVVLEERVVDTSVPPGLQY